MKTNHSEKYVLLGHTGYIGEAFATELKRRGESVILLTRKELDYSRFQELRSFLVDVRPTFLINCAGFTGKPNVDACETRQADAFLGNVILVQTIAQACDAVGIRWGHVSSGCIYAGAKVKSPDGVLRVEKDLMRPDIRSVWERDRALLSGFTETDIPNFSFRDPPCSFYSGTKALAEEILKNWSSVYTWRLRIPFDHIDMPRNYLSKIQNYAKVYNNLNSLSHREDFVKACIDLWSIRAEVGVYNVTNPGFVTTEEVVSRIQRNLKLDRHFSFFEDNSEFYSVATAPRSNTILETQKLLSTGVVMRHVVDAIEDSLAKWTIACSTKPHLLSRIKEPV